MKRQHPERDAQIIEQVIHGRQTLESVGRQYGLTRERVRQIVLRDHPHFNIRSAKSADTAARKAARRQQTRERQQEWRRKVDASVPPIAPALRWSEESMVEVLQRVAEEIGHSPSIREWIEGEYQPSAALYLQRFDTWNAAKTAAGLPLNTSARRNYVREFSEEDMIDAVALFLRTGTPNSPHAKFGAYQYDRWRKQMVEAGFLYPSLSLIRVRLGAWQGVKRAAIEKNALNKEDSDD